MLAYCTSLGVTTVLVTALPSPRYMPGLLPDLTTHRMASACTATLPWQHNKKLAAATNNSFSTQNLVASAASTGKPQQQKDFVNATGNRQPNTPARSDGGAGPVNNGDKGNRIPLASTARNWHKLSSRGSQFEYIEPWLYLNPLYAGTASAR